MLFCYKKILNAFCIFYRTSYRALVKKNTNKLEEYHKFVTVTHSELPHIHGLKAQFIKTNDMERQMTAYSRLSFRSTTLNATHFVLQRYCY